MIKGFEIPRCDEADLDESLRHGHVMGTDPNAFSRHDLGTHEELDAQMVALLHTYGEDVE